MNPNDTLRLSLTHLDSDHWQADLRCEGLAPGAGVELVLRPEHASQDVPYGQWDVDDHGRLAPMDLRSALIFRDFEVDVHAICRRPGRASNAVRLVVPSGELAHCAVA